MKYKDNRFLKYQEKQRNGDYEYYSNKTERQIRREREHRNEMFYQKFILGKIDKFWWKNLSDGDKESIIRSHGHQMNYFSISKRERSNYWYSGEVFDTWSEWYDYIKTTFKPNKISLREDKLKVLGL